MSEGRKGVQVHPVLAGVIIAAVVLGIGVAYYKATEVPQTAGKNPKGVSLKKLIGEETIGPEDAQVKIQAFFLPTTGEASKQVLRDLANKYPQQVQCYTGSPNMGVGQRLQAKDGDVFVNGKRVATGGDVQTAVKMVEGQLGAPPG